MADLPRDRAAAAISAGQGPGGPRLDAAVARRLAMIAQAEGGLAIDPEKRDFFVQRIAGPMRRQGVADAGSYAALLERPEMREARRAFMEAVVTHTTQFFREEKHYDFLKTTGFGAMLDADGVPRRSLRIWSAACSNGAELYSALMAAAEFMDDRRRVVPVEGVGTDLSEAILAAAGRGIYSEPEIKGLSEPRRRRFLLRDRSGAARFRIAPEIRTRCRWSQSNLTDRAPAGPREADVIFLRNVLIYFDRPTQKRVIETLAARLSPGGYLLTGHSEPLSEASPALEAVGASIYRRRDRPA